MHALCQVVKHSERLESVHLGKDMKKTREGPLEKGAGAVRNGDSGTEK
jgi:hypothetical protein